jgi:hypothetical protein
MTATSVTNAAGQLILDGLYGPKLVTCGFGPPAGSRWAGRGASLQLDAYGTPVAQVVQECPQGDSYYLTITQVPAFPAGLTTSVLALRTAASLPPMALAYARASPDGAGPEGYTVTWLLTPAQTAALSPGVWYARASVGTSWGDRLTPEDLPLTVTPAAAEPATLARGLPATVVAAQYTADGSPYDLSAMVLRWTTTGAGTFSKDQTQGAVLQVGAGLVQIPLSAAETAALAPRTLLYGRLADTITGLAWDLPPILVGP